MCITIIFPDKLYSDTDSNINSAGEIKRTKMCFVWTYFLQIHIKHSVPPLETVNQ